MFGHWSSRQVRSPHNLCFERSLTEIFLLFHYTSLLGSTVHCSFQLRLQHQIREFVICYANVVVVVRAFRHQAEGITPRVLWSRFHYLLQSGQSQHIVHVVVVVVVTFWHQAEEIAPIEVLLSIPLFSAVEAITENGPCTNYSFVEVQNQTVPHE